ncbi:MAG: insulinase family protein [Rhodospirillales bacterium]|nr:insulinase family protein [Rhodospirillales bacterium]
MSVRVSELANGLRVVSDVMETVESISLGAWVAVGARDEPAKLNGISHLLEHMAFKGTERRDALAIAAEIEAVGGQLNAYTARESTAYFAKILKADLALAVDIIADILQHSVMDAGELAREQDVIVQEINQSNDTPDDIIFDCFQTIAFPDQAIGRPVLGSAPLIRAMDSRRLLDYMRGHYSAPNIVFAAAGRLDHDRLVELAAAAFDSLPAPIGSPRQPARYVGGDFRESRDLEQAHLLMGMHGIAYDDKDFYATTVFSTLLGGGMSSRLFQEVREKRGLVYSIYSYTSAYVDGGLFGIYAGTGEKQVSEVVPLVFDEIAKLAKGAPADEIARARAQVKAAILMSLESTSSRCEQLARQMIVFKRPLAVDEIVAQVEAVDGTAIARVATRLMESRPTLAGIGPGSGMQGLERAAKRLRSGEASN